MIQNILALIFSHFAILKFHCFRLFLIYVSKCTFKKSLANMLNRLFRFSILKFLNQFIFCWRICTEQSIDCLVLHVGRLSNHEIITIFLLLLHARLKDAIRFYLISVIFLLDQALCKESLKPLETQPNKHGKIWFHIYYGNHE